MKSPGAIGKMVCILAYKDLLNDVARANYSEKQSDAGS